MRAAPEEYLSLELRAHQLLRHVPLYDVSVVDLPGGGDGRSLTDVLHLQGTTARSPATRSKTLPPRHMPPFTRRFEAKLH